MNIVRILKILKREITMTRNHYDYDLMVEDKMVYKACLMSLAQIGEHCVRLRKKK